MIRPDVVLHIEELVLHGFAPGDRYAIANALKQELSDLLTRQFVEPSDFARFNRKVLCADAGTFQVETLSGSDSIGAQIAQAVQGVLIK